VARKLERDSSNTLYFVARIDFGIECLRLVKAARRTKIDSTEQFTDDHQVDSANRIAAKGRTVDQSFENTDRPEIRVIAQQLSQIEQPVFAFFPGRQMIEPGITDSAKENRVRRQANILASFWQRFAMTFNGNAANIGLDILEFVIMLAGNDVQNPASFSQHLRADSITRQPRYARFHVSKSDPDLQPFFYCRRLRGI